MRPPMRIALYAFCALLVVAAGILAVAPRVFDWDHYKPVIAAKVREATGRELAIDGPLEVVLFPTPGISAEGLRLSNPAGAAVPDMVTVRSLEAALAFGPLITGELEVRRLVLVDPVIELERLDDGRMNWDLGPPEAPKAPWIEGASALRSLVVENGTVVYRDAPRGRSERLERLDLSLSGDPLAESSRGEGSAQVLGVLLPFTLSVGALSTEKPIPLSFAFDLPNANGKATFEGLLEPGEDGRRLEGSLRVTGEGLENSSRAFARALARLGGAGVLRRAYRLEGRVRASASSFVLDKARVRVGDIQGTGEVHWALDLDPPCLDIELALARVDLDSLLGAEAGGEAPAATQMEPKGASADEAVRRSGQQVEIPLSPLESEAEAPSEAPLPFTMPKDLTATLDFSVGVVLYKGGIVRQARLVAALNNGVITIEQASALLPGGAHLAVFGQARLSQPGDPRFEGRVEVGADNLRSVLNWLQIEVSPVPRDRLYTFNAASVVTANKTGVALSEIDLRLDASHVTGAAGLAFEETLRLAASLTIDRFNADAYFPPPEGEREAKGDASSLPFLPFQSGRISLLDGFDAELAARIASLIYQGTTFEDLRLIARLEQGRLSVREAHAPTEAGP